MPDMQSAMRKAGLPASPAERRCEKCGKPFVPKEPHHRTCQDCFGKDRAGISFSQLFPPGYPDYFDSGGVLKCEYMTELAEKIAQAFGRGHPKLTTHQLRAFYQHVKRQQAAVKNGRPFREVLVELCKLKPFARERAEKEKIPHEFEQFISRNVDKVKDQKAFAEGFVEHFQAVVAYCAGTIQER